MRIASLYVQKVFCNLPVNLVLVLVLSVLPVAASPFAYVTNSYGTTDAVSVIDTATSTVVATIPVGGWPYGVAITPDGATAYVTNNRAATVSVIATATNTVVATIPVGDYPYGMAITPDGAFAYVANWISRAVSIIDTTTNTVVTTIPVGDTPYWVAITPDGAFVYVTSQSATVSVIATATNTVVATITVGGAPRGIAITPDSAHAYVVNAINSVSGTVSVIATATNTVVATITVGGAPWAVAITPDGARAYVANAASGTVSVIDIATNTVVDTIPAGGAYPFGFGVAITPDGARAYVTNANDSTISVIDTATNTVVDTISVADYPYGVAITPVAVQPPAIEVSPTSYNFGNVQWGQTNTAMFTILNIGGGELTLSEISLSDAFGVFSITSDPSPLHLQPRECTTVEVSFSPQAILTYMGVLMIKSSDPDPDEQSIDVSLSGTGVLADTPSEQVTAVIDYINDAIAIGELTGVGPGNSAEKRVNALINMINAAGDLLEAGQTDQGCYQIHAISLKVDGDPTPPDFVTGPATEGLANIIEEIGAYYGCQL